LGFRVWGLGFGVEGYKYRVSGFRVLDLVFGDWGLGLWFGVWDLRFKV